MQPWRIEIPDCAPEQVRALREALGISDALGQVLVRRGLADPAQARAFVNCEERHPASAFEGVGESVELIARRIARGGRITVHGDYDVDGICSTAVLVGALRELGADVDWYLPDRMSDGYGLKVSTVERLAARGTELLLTADCAISAVEEVQAALAAGLEVIVTDHHAPRADGLLPGAPIVHPAVCGYPCRELCAAAVAYKLAEALFEHAGRDPRELERDLDLVALATIADVVPLLGENRTLAARGLRALAGTSKPGLLALMAQSSLAPAAIDERSVAFALAPRLNAAGRLYRADAGLELLLTRDPQRARAIACELDSINGERRRVEQRIRFEAEAQMREQGEQPAYVLAGEGWHPGVTGIVASRLVELSGRPVVMIALADGRGRASGRSVEGFDLLAGLSACSEHLLRYGGHRAAAGLEIEAHRVGEFARAFRSHAREAICAQDLVAVERVDAVVGCGELTLGLAEELARLAPHGRGNPRPCLLIEGATFQDTRLMGEGRHARFSVRSGALSARAVAFGNGGRLGVAEGEPALATFALEVNEWRGVSEPRLVLRRARALAAPHPDELPFEQRSSAPRAAHAETAPRAAHAASALRAAPADPPPPPVPLPGCGGQLELALF